MSKILVNAEAGVGKTDLLRTLDPKTTLVISRDSKDFTLPIPHMLVREYVDMDTLLDGVDTEMDGEMVHTDGIADKLEIFYQKTGEYPEVVVIDTFSQITQDVIEIALQKSNKYGSQGAEINSELSKFTKFIHEYLEGNDVDIIILTHVMKDKSEDKVEYTAFGQGKFKDKGGIYSTVDEAVTLVREGKYITAYTADPSKQARTRTDMPYKMSVESNKLPVKSRILKDGEEYYTLKMHLDKVRELQNVSLAFAL